MDVVSMCQHRTRALFEARVRLRLWTLPRVHHGIHLVTTRHIRIRLDLRMIMTARRDKVICVHLHSESHTRIRVSFTPNSVILTAGSTNL